MSSHVLHVVEPEAVHTDRQLYVTTITSAWRQIAEGVLGVGRCLIQAKAELPHGDFGKMIAADLPVLGRDRDAERAQALALVQQHLGVVTKTCCAHVQHLDALAEAALWLLEAVEGRWGRPELRGLPRRRSGTRPIRRSRAWGWTSIRTSPSRWSGRSG